MSITAKIGLAATIGALALTSATASAASASASASAGASTAAKSATCNVQHYFYNTTWNLYVDLWNECSTTKWVCISRKYPVKDNGPHAVAGNSGDTWGYGSTGAAAGTGVYYAKNSSSCK